MKADSTEGLSRDELCKKLIDSYEKHIYDVIKTHEDVLLFNSVYRMNEKFKKEAPEDQLKRVSEIKALSKVTCDFEYWLKSEYWTHQEASAILCGLDPNASKFLFDIYSIKYDSTFLDFVPLAKKYRETFVLFSRKFKWECPPTRLPYLSAEVRIVKPAEAIEWAMSINLDVPKQLVSHVTKNKSYSESANKKSEKTLLRILAAVTELAGDRIPKKAADNVIAEKLSDLGFNSPQSRRVQDYLNMIKRLEKDKQ